MSDLLQNPFSAFEKSPSATRCFAKALELYLAVDSLPGGGILSDQCLSHVKVVEGSRLCVDSMPRNLCMNSLGPIAFVPIVGGLPVCAAFGGQFFLDPRGLKGPLGYLNPHGSPAWGVVQVQEAKPRKGEAPPDKPPNTLEVKTRTTTFKYKDPKATGPRAKDATTNVQVTHYYLVPKMEWCDETCDLTRLPIPQAVKKEDVEKTDDPLPAPKTKAKAKAAKVRTTFGAHLLT